MSKRTHERELARARAKRAAAAAAARRRRLRVVAGVTVAVVAFGIVGASALLGGGGEDAAEGPCPPPPDDVPEVTSSIYDAPPEVAIDADATYTATLATTCGDIVLELDAAAAPRTVGNFVALAEDGYYAGVTFHRVVEGFMIQGGDPAGTGCGREDCAPGAEGPTFPGYSFEDELALAEQVVADEGGYPRGTLAMANRGPSTNGSQFFIVQSPTPYPLPPNYTVFGHAVDGLDVVDRIAEGPVDGEAPVEPVRILSVEIERS